MTLPGFLIIGGMKCGSTTLYRDLLTQPGVFFPIDKEPENLTNDAVLTDAGRASYAELFKHAGKHQLCAEASTAYTKRPTFERVADRAHTVLGADLKLIYLVREPISRIVSHHHHQVSRGAMPVDIADAVTAHPELVDYTRYAHQAKPWLDRFGPDQVRVVRFEDFIADRPGQVASLCGWLGIDSDPSRVDPDKVFNRSAANPVLTGRWTSVRNNAVYSKLIRPLLPTGLKDRIRSMVLPKAPPRPATPSADLQAKLLDQLQADHAELSNIMGLAGKPVWPITPAA